MGERSTLVTEESSRPRSERTVAVWRSWQRRGHINEVALRQAQLVLEWMTVSGLNPCRCEKFISVCPTVSVNSAWPSVHKCKCAMSTAAEGR